MQNTLVMRISTSQYEYYAALHNDFSEAYTTVNQYVISLYTLPKHFIDETGPLLDRFVREYSIPGSPRNHDLSTRAILDFVGQVDAFTLNTVELFDLHRTHVDNCSAYMKVVHELETKHTNSTLTECATDYVRLTPQLQVLQNGLTEIKLKADNMVRRLDTLEKRWEKIKPRVTE